METPEKPPEALESLRAAAEALYRSPRGPMAFAALERAEEALEAIRRRIDDPEVARAADELARARALLAAQGEAEVRSAANRLYGSAVILLEPHRPWQAIHLMLLRVLLRDMVSAADAGDGRAAERLALSARAACRSVGLDPAVARSRRHGAIERALAVADAARRMDRRADLRDAARDALGLVDELEVELAVGGAIAWGDEARSAHGFPGALRDGSPIHGS
jgi:hypothetical protein